VQEHWYFSLQHNVRKGWEDHPASCLVDTEGLFIWINLDSEATINVHQMSRSRMCGTVCTCPSKHGV